MSPQAAALRETSNPSGLVCHVPRHVTLINCITVGEEAAFVSEAGKKKNPPCFGYVLKEI